jgi:hypothetical protein
MAAAHQSSITYEFILSEAQKIKDMLDSDDEALHRRAAEESDRLWDLIDKHAHADLSEAMAYDCTLLTDVRNWIEREYNVPFAKSAIESFIRLTDRRYRRIALKEK